MDTETFLAVRVTFIGGPLHRQHLSVPRGTRKYSQEGVRYEISTADLGQNGEVDPTKLHVYFRAVLSHDLDGVDVLRSSFLSARNDDAAEHEVWHRR